MSDDDVQAVLLACAKPEVNLRFLTNVVLGAPVFSRLFRQQWEGVLTDEPAAG